MILIYLFDKITEEIASSCNLTLIWGGYAPTDHQRNCSPSMDACQARTHAQHSCGPPHSCPTRRETFGPPSADYFPQRRLCVQDGAVQLHRWDKSGQLFQVCFLPVPHSSLPMGRQQVCVGSTHTAREPDSESQPSSRNTHPLPPH